ncbi:MAG: hypothetical protein AAB676_21805, partial [Verrucomicrobiota bacterium]
SDDHFTFNSLAHAKHWPCVGIFQAIDLNNFLLGVHRFLAVKHRYTHVNRLIRLLDELMPAGLDAGWVETVRQKLSGKGGMVSVSHLTEAFQAELAKAAVSGGTTHYDTSHPGLPAGRDQIEVGPVEPPGPGKRDSHEEFKRSVLRKCGISKDDPNALNKLEDQLRGYWNLKTPLFALTPNIDPGGMPRFPWHYLLIFKPDDVATHLDVSRETAVYLQGIHQELRRLRQAR